MFKRKAKSLEVIDNPKPVIHKQTKKLVQHIITIHDDGETYKLFEFCEVYDMPAQRWVMYDNLLEDRNRALAGQNWPKDWKRWKRLLRRTA